MNISIAFLRIFFILLSIVFFTIFMTSTPTGDSTTNILWGMGLGITFGCFLVALDMLFRRYNLRAFNIAIIGVFIGYLMGEALLLVFNAILEISSISVVIQPQTLEIIKIALFLFGIYLGTIMTLRASDELYVSIPL